MHLAEEHCFVCASALLLCADDYGSRHCCMNTMDTGHLTKAEGQINNDLITRFVILNDPLSIYSFVVTTNFGNTLF